MARKPTSKPEAGTEENVVEFPQTRVVASANPILAAESINRNELISVQALTSYVAHKEKVAEELIRDVLQSEFHVKDLARIRRDDYERVIKFLVDLRTDLLIN